MKHIEMRTIWLNVKGHTYEPTHVRRGSRAGRSSNVDFDSTVGKIETAQNRKHVSVRNSALGRRQKFDGAATSIFGGLGVRAQPVKVGCPIGRGSMRLVQHGDCCASKEHNRP
jgi:hypothetical protein